MFIMKHNNQIIYQFILVKNNILTIKTKTKPGQGCTQQQTLKVINNTAVSVYCKFTAMHLSKTTL